MQTSLIETKEIEAYVLRKQTPEQSVLFQTKLLLQPELKEKILWQEKTLHLIKIRGRYLLKTELKEVEKIVFTEASFLSFRQRIAKIFKL